MAGDLVLITGATGFIGYQLVVFALKAGYRVRCAIRTQDGIAKVLAAPSMKKLAPTDEQLSWVIVPDITAPHAYDEAVRGVAYILHCASPVPNMAGNNPEGDDEAIYIQPAVGGVIGMLESGAAHASQTLKRIVITSSVVAIIPAAHFANEPPSGTQPYNGETRVAVHPPPYTNGSFDSYQASKIAALNATDAWMKEHSPSYDIINILPAWVWGRDELSTTVGDFMGKASTLVAGILLGNKAEMHVNRAVVSVQDVAQAHVLALDGKVAGGQSFVLGSLEKFEDITAITKKAFPEALEKGIFKEGGFQPTITIPMDASATEERLGLRLMPYEDVITATAGQFLELEEKSS